MLVGIVYYIRVIGIEKLLLAAQRIKQGHSNQKKFQRERRRFFYASRYTLISNMLSLLIYKKAIAYIEGNKGSTFQLVDKKTFYLKRQAIKLSYFYIIAQDLVIKVEKILQQERLQIIRIKDCFTINIKGIVDNVTFIQYSTSFINQLSNNLYSKLEQILIQYRQSKQGQKLQTVKGQQRETEVKRYLQ